MPSGKAWLLVKTGAFTILFPVTLTVVGPFLIVPRPARTSGTAIAAGGASLVLVGAAVYLRCAWDFVAQGKGTPAPYDPPRFLVRLGLYTFSRNPMYVGVVTILIGQTLFFHSWPLLAYSAVVAASFHLRVVFYEEPALRRLFGEAYEEYCRGVPRWLFRLR